MPADDTLDIFETRIHETEYKLYPEVLGTFGRGEERMNIDQ